MYAGVRVQTRGQTRCPCPFRGDCWGFRNVLAPPLTLLSGWLKPPSLGTRRGGPGWGLSTAALRDLSLGMRTVPAVTKQPGHSCCESGTGDLGLPSARFSEAAPGPGLRRPCCAVLGAQHRVGGGPESVGRVDKRKKETTDAGAARPSPLGLGRVTASGDDNFDVFLAETPADTSFSECSPWSQIWSVISLRFNVRQALSTSDLQQVRCRSRLLSHVGRSLCPPRPCRGAALRPRPLRHQLGRLLSCRTLDLQGVFWRWWDGGCLWTGRRVWWAGVPTTSLPPPAVPSEGKRQRPLKAPQWGPRSHGPWSLALSELCPLGPASWVPQVPALVTPWPFRSQWRNQSRVTDPQAGAGQPH